MDIDELVEHWTLLKDEQALVAGKRGATRLGFAVLLKFYTQHHAALDGFGILPGYGGVLIRDDYVGYHKYDPHVAGVQLCCAHLLRDLQGVIDNAPDEQHAAWARVAQRILRGAGRAVEQAHAAGHTSLHENERASIEAEFLQAARCGISVNPHSGQKKSKVRQLAERLADKALKPSTSPGTSLQDSPGPTTHPSRLCGTSRSR